MTQVDPANEPQEDVEVPVPQGLPGLLLHETIMVDKLAGDLHPEAEKSSGNDGSRMNWFRDKRIMGKMTLVMMLTSGISVLLAGAAFVANDFVQLRAIYQRELSAAGSLLAAGAASAVSAGDPAAVQQTLQVLRDDERIVSAELYSRSGNRLLASYFRPGFPASPLPAITKPGMYSEDGSILLIREVVLDGIPVGRLAIRSDARDLGPVFQRDVSMALLLLAMCTLIALFFTSRLRRMIAQPLMNLAETAAAIPRKDGSLPWQPGQSDDEVEVLTEAFSTLLAHVKEKEAAVSNYRALFEEETAKQAAVREAAQAELATALERADETARSRAEFLARMGRGIRSRMNGLIGMSQLALETNLTEAQQEYITAASDSAQDLLKVVDDLVDFSRIETGSAVLERHEFGISETLYEVMREFSPAAVQKGLSLLLDVHNEIPVSVIGDAERFRQIIATLIGNSLKFTDIGKVTVEASPLFHSDRTVGIHFKVRDTGRGLEMQQFERSVEPFGQPDHSDTNPVRGSGLSLAIASRLIGAMGGSFWLESEIGWGSTFHFTATFETAVGSGAFAPDLNSLSGVSVLVADAGAVTRRTLQQLLARWQMKPSLAATGQETIDIMRQAASARRPFDLVLVDSEMAGTDGGDLVTEIREHPELGSPVITALISINSVSVTDLARKFGPGGYLVKPPSHSMLLKTVSEAVSVIRARDTTAVPAPALARAKRAHILVAEDNVLSQAVAVSVLIKQGYEVTLVRSGIQAVEAHSRGGIDLILMDLQMPGMSGIEATQLIRRRESGSGGRVPILALTAHAMASDRERCFAAGMDDYMSKPIQVQELRKLIRQWLNENEPAGSGIPAWP